MDQQKGLDERFITGEEPDLKWVARVGDGFFGEVHQVVRTDNVEANASSCDTTQNMTGRLQYAQTRRLMKQVFARKIKPLFGPLAPRDIKFEEGRLKTFCKLPNHRNMVKVLGHGLLRLHPANEDLPFYTIDTELCGLNLRDYINQYLKPPNGGGSLPEIWSITQQIASGTEYLCQHGIFQYHLRPESGT